MLGSEKLIELLRALREGERRVRGEHGRGERRTGRAAVVELVVLRERLEDQIEAKADLALALDHVVGE